MIDDSDRGIPVNSKTLQFVIALFTVGSMIWGGVTYVNGQDYRLGTVERKYDAREQRLESQISEIKSSIHELTGKQEVVGEKLGELSGVIRGLERDAN
jgi:hypothetical protein